MPKTYKSEALAAVHEMMEGLHETGAIEKQTLQAFDEGCLAPAIALKAKEISLREIMDEAGSLL
jgi:putative transcriptional regulator